MNDFKKIDSVRPHSSINLGHVRICADYLVLLEHIINARLGGQTSCLTDDELFRYISERLDSVANVLFSFECLPDEEEE